MSAKGWLWICFPKWRWSWVTVTSPNDHPAHVPKYIIDCERIKAVQFLMVHIPKWCRLHYLKKKKKKSHWTQWSIYCTPCHMNTSISCRQHWYRFEDVPLILFVTKIPTVHSASRCTLGSSSGVFYFQWKLCCVVVISNCFDGDTLWSQTWPYVHLPHSHCFGNASCTVAKKDHPWLAWPVCFIDFS